MVTTKRIGTPGPDNDKLGGVPVFHYYNFASKGRGEVIRLFFEDAGIAFDDVRYEFDEWNNKTPEQRAEINPSGTFPFVQVGDKVHVQTYSMLRYYARQLGQYDGKTSEEKYFSDLITDVVSDWRTKFVDANFATLPKGLVPGDNPAAVQNHKEYLMPRYYLDIIKLPYWEGVGSRHIPPDADLVLWQMYHDERELGGPVEQLISKECPKLKKMIEAVESRPKLKEYWSSDRYYN
ncbi:hypothetical protein OIO90_001706 [Microbotryomycetes sp. JL221]|nr:hypothetical protein OIO90_001706 [Microbotryomycetes sp. JL221]